MTPSLHSRPRYSVHVGLLLTWLAILCWQFFEHRNVDAAAREKLLNRARDISNTIALVSRSGFPGVIRQSRLEEALRELTESPEVESVAVLNSIGEIVVQAGDPIELQPDALPQEGARWEDASVIVVNPVEFGEISDADGQPQPPTIVIPPREEGERDERDDRDRRDRFDPRRETEGPPPPGPPPGVERDDRPGTMTVYRRRSSRVEIFSRPPWMSQHEFEQLIEKRGLHAFVIVLATQSYKDELTSDLVLRFFISGLTLIALGSIGFAWYNRDNSISLQMRLVRSQEMNEHLREMNLAAAGLAHETRNPLNIVRGLAQLIEQDSAVPRETHSRAARIVEEVDNVNHRLNEFIKYSRPTEPRPAPASIMAVIQNVRVMLEADCDDKSVKLETAGPALTVLADESLLRQVVFNLLLNAIQAVHEGGTVRITAADRPGGEAALLVEDNGPGVSDEMREHIFSPYFTSRDQGSGLGLAIVRQIVLAHQWEITCGRSDLGGAAFQVAGIKNLGK